MLDDCGRDMEAWRAPYPSIKVMAQVVIKLGLEGATLVERDQCVRLAIVSVEEHPPAESYRSASLSSRRGTYRARGVDQDAQSQSQTREASMQLLSAPSRLSSAQAGVVALHGARRCRRGCRSATRAKGSPVD